MIKQILFQNNFYIFLGGLIMKNIIVGTTTGAICGAAISMVIPCKSSNHLKKRLIRKGRKLKSRLIKKIAGVVCKVI